MFHQLILNRVFESKPELWVHIDVGAPHGAINNLFALGAATIAANIHDYQLGKLNVREVSVNNWVLDYREACQLLTVIRHDGAWRAALDDLQRWIMDQGMTIVTVNQS